MLVEVVGRDLNLRGPRYRVGERLFLDPTNPQHREAIDNGWVRPVAPATAAPVAPPVDKMIAQAPAAKTVQDSRRSISKKQVA